MRIFNKMASSCYWQRYDDIIDGLSYFFYTEYEIKREKRFALYFKTKALIMEGRYLV